ncbi:hypothetical protein LR48_Vigan05g082200 [Vigna angularis]|uniref:Uncharacterized protein n=1 Tax=Phaseolus angularis TaxID=3914 RepID=A0A0L9UKD1_PHAAN|nr:hypothetical protein LR48_Vigan05g082200 [Vigna angularis]
MHYWNRPHVKRGLHEVEGEGTRAQLSPRAVQHVQGSSRPTEDGIWSVQHKGEGRPVADASSKLKQRLGPVFNLHIAKEEAGNNIPRPSSSGLEQAHGLHPHADSSLGGVLGEIAALCPTREGEEVSRPASSTLPPFGQQWSAGSGNGVQCSLHKTVRSRAIAETVRFSSARQFNSGSSSLFGHCKTIPVLAHSLQEIAARSVETSSKALSSFAADFDRSFGHIFDRPFGQDYGQTVWSNKP